MNRAAFSAAMSRLWAHRTATSPMDMRAAFAGDPGRFDALSRRFGDLLLYLSKCAIDADTLALLSELAKAAEIEAKRDAMFSGEKINVTENRAVLHTALRAGPDATVIVDGEDVMPAIRHVLGRMASFAEAVRSGASRGSTGEAIADVVNIGIGGSDLGPAMATLALAPWHTGPRLHFVSNVDGAHIADTLKTLDPATTMFIVASKTFTTIETMTNAATARRWIAEALGEAAVGRHFAAVSTALDKVAAFGISPDRVFGFWDWVGGRYSLWSAIGLPVMIAIGAENFDVMLVGARAMDGHFRDAPVERNLPMLLGLLGFWHRAVCGHAARAVIPYDQRLSRLPAYLQQLDMESNGKCVTASGLPTGTPTGPLVWGEPGTNGQHAFFQLLHQGTDVIPVEFIVAAEGHEPALKHQHDLLVANCLAQAEALMRGRTRAEALAQLNAKGMTAAEAEKLAPHRVFAGNRPSITIVHRRLDPFALGRLIALYEHRVFVEAALYDINAFDQWGVELGKELATGLQGAVEGREDASAHDASTAGLIAHIHEFRGLA